MSEPVVMTRTLAHEQANTIRQIYKAKGASEVYVREHPTYPKQYWMVVADVPPGKMKKVTDYLHQQKVYHQHINGFTETDAVRFAVWRNG